MGSNTTSSRPKVVRFPSKRLGQLVMARWCRVNWLGVWCLGVELTKLVGLTKHSLKTARNIPSPPSIGIFSGPQTCLPWPLVSLG